MTTGKPSTVQQLWSCCANVRAVSYAGVRDFVHNNTPDIPSGLITYER